MALKVSFKLFIVISLLFGVFFACVPPVDIGDFMGSDEVKAILGEVVKLTSDSAGIPGNGKIINLASAYYKLELYENGSPIECYFVKNDGTTSSSLGEIEKLTAGEITGLTNGNTYRVIPAELYTNSGDINYFALSDAKSRTAKVTDGKVTIRENRQSTTPTKCYFTISPTIAVDKDYNVMKIITAGTDSPWPRERASAYRKSGQVSIITSITDSEYQKCSSDSAVGYGIYQFDPSYVPAVTKPSFLSNESIMELPAVGTTNDYVFIEYNSNGDISKFCVLTVEVKSPLNGGGTITITPPPNPEDTVLKLTCNGSTINENDVITISLSSVSNKTITATGVDSYNWYLDSTLIATSDNIVIGTTSNLTTAKTCTIIVEGTVTGGIVYSKWFMLKITP